MTCVPRLIQLSARPIVGCIWPISLWIWPILHAMWLISFPIWPIQLEPQEFTAKISAAPPINPFTHLNCVPWLIHLPARPIVGCIWPITLWIWPILHAMWPISLPIWPIQLEPQEFTAKISAAPPINPFTHLNCVPWLIHLSARPIVGSIWPIPFSIWPILHAMWPISFPIWPIQLEPQEITSKISAALPISPFPHLNCVPWLIHLSARPIVCCIWPISLWIWPILLAMWLISFPIWPIQPKLQEFTAKKAQLYRFIPISSG